MNRIHYLFQAVVETGNCSGTRQERGTGLRAGKTQAAGKLAQGGASLYILVQAGLPVPARDFPNP